MGIQFLMKKLKALKPMLGGYYLHFTQAIAACLWRKTMN
jgi:hypothetical protein